MPYTALRARRPRWRRNVSRVIHRVNLPFDPTSRPTDDGFHIGPTDDIRHSIDGRRTTFDPTPRLTGLAQLRNVSSPGASGSGSGSGWDRHSSSPGNVSLTNVALAQSQGRGPGRGLGRGPRRRPGLINDTRWNRARQDPGTFTVIGHNVLCGPRASPYAVGVRSVFTPSDAACQARCLSEDNNCMFYACACRHPPPAPSAASLARASRQTQCHGRIEGCSLLSCVQSGGLVRYGAPQRMGRAPAAHAPPSCRLLPSSFFSLAQVVAGPRLQHVGDLRRAMAGQPICAGNMAE